MVDDLQQEQARPVSVSIIGKSAAVTTSDATFAWQQVDLFGKVCITNPVMLANVLFFLVEYPCEGQPAPLRLAISKRRSPRCLKRSAACTTRR